MINFLFPHKLEPTPPPWLHPCLAKLETCHVREILQIWCTPVLLSTYSIYLSVCLFSLSLSLITQVFDTLLHWLIPHVWGDIFTKFPCHVPFLHPTPQIPAKPQPWLANAQGGIGKLISTHLKITRRVPRTWSRHWKYRLNFCGNCTFQTSDCFVKARTKDCWKSFAKSKSQWHSQCVLHTI